MAEYDLVCDACHEPLATEDAVISWTARDGAESGFALTHAAHAPAGATEKLAVRGVVSPNGYLRFVNERVGSRIADTEPLRAILSALAPFVMRPDNPTEMDSMRAASFGARLGVKPGTQPSALAGGAQEKQEGGK
ncbi:MAG: hypothetical protein HYX56_06900 [Chloroflexi bacterium]|nr:hypothetical protein [Chloroflexota bacterium]